MFTSPVTGSAIASKLTSPTYTITKSSFPDTNGVAYNVTALGGTQTDVTVHSQDTVFSTWFTWPKVIKTFIGSVQTLVGVLRVPKNRFVRTTKKAVAVNGVGGVSEILISTSYEIPAGAGTFGSAQVAAAISLHQGSCAADAEGIYNACVLGTYPS